MNSEHNAFCKDFWKMWLAKLLRTLISVKVLTIVVITWISTCLLINKHISSNNWVSVIISGIVAIVLARSVFQVASLKNGHDKNNENEDKE